MLAGELGWGLNPLLPSDTRMGPGVKDLTWLMAHVHLHAASERLGNASQPSPCSKFRLRP